MQFLEVQVEGHDATMEKALHDMPLLRRFAGLDAGVDTMPDEIIILYFRHLLERYGLSKHWVVEINSLLTEQGLLLRKGTTGAKRDLEMTQARKSNQ